MVLEKTLESPLDCKETQPVHGLIGSPCSPKDSKLNIQKMKIMASGPITSWEIGGETVGTVSNFIFWGDQPWVFFGRNDAQAYVYWKT